MLSSSWGQQGTNTGKHSYATTIPTYHRHRQAFSGSIEGIGLTGGKRATCITKSHFFQTMCRQVFFFFRTFSIACTILHIYSQFCHFWGGIIRENCHSPTLNFSSVVSARGPRSKMKGRVFIFSGKQYARKKNSSAIYSLSI